MEPIKLNHWYVHDNRLSIALLRFYVMISILPVGDSLYCSLQVGNGPAGENCILSFPTLEEAISFTENIISQANSLEGIRSAYQEIVFPKKEEKFQKRKKPINNH